MDAAWELVNLLKEYNVNFSVLIPYHARSAATMITFGAEEIVMGKMAALGPIDPTVRIDGGELGGMEISVSDIDSYEDFFRDEYQISKPEDKMKAFAMMGEHVPPVLLGKAYRRYLQTKKDARMLLKPHFKDKEKAEKIVNLFIKENSTHTHSISRPEAKEAGLNVKFAEPKLEKILWDLYKEYEKDMEMEIPYIDSPPPNSNRREVTFSYIESQNKKSKKFGVIKFNKLEFPKGSHLISIEETPAILTPGGETIPLIPKGILLSEAGHIYDKTEEVYWLNE